MSIWTNKKFGKKQFTSHYWKDTAGERVFILIYKFKKGGAREITFESWQMAKALGWIKQK